MRFWRDPFWQTTPLLLRYKRKLALALVGALISALCFGAGLTSLALVFQVLLSDRRSLRDILAEKLSAWQAAAPTPDAPATALGSLRQAIAPVVDDAGQRLVAALPADPYQGFLLVMAIIAVLTIVGSLARYVHELIVMGVSLRAALVWRGRLFRRLIHAPYEQVLRTGNSDHISRVLADTSALELGYRSILGKTVAEVTKGAAALAVAVALDWKLTALALIAAPLIGTALRKFGKKIRRAATRAFQERGRVLHAISEALGGIAVVKVHNAEGYERRRFGRVNRALFAQEMRARQARALSSPVIDTLALLSVIAVGCLAAYLIYGGQSNATDLFAVMVALAAAGNSLKPLTSLHNQLQEASAAAARVLEVLRLPVEPTGPDADADAPALPRHRRQIAFERVTYAYPGQARQAVHEVSLTIPFGTTVAIVGGNGSGKTTLLSMAPRLLSPQQGRVLIDGADVAAVSLRSLREQMAVVTQQTVLFQGTIAQNIAYGRAHAPRERIVAAAQAAFADEFVRALPKGYDTPLGEAGTGLSGGQRQRLAIARAILRDPAILILDEATSQIDAESEAKINAALRGLRHGRTILVIAHRLSTVIDADLIVVMAEGRIVDQGTHAELLRRCEIYRVLAQTQLRPPEATEAA